MGPTLKEAVSEDLNDSDQSDESDEQPILIQRPERDSDVAEKISDSAQNAKDSIKSAGSKVADKSSDAMASAKDSIKAKSNDLTNNPPLTSGSSHEESIFQRFGTYIKESMPWHHTETFSEKISNTAQHAKESIQSTGSDFAEFSVDKKDQLKKQGQDMMDRVGESIHDVKQKTEDIVENMIDRTETMFSDLKQTMKEL